MLPHYASEQLLTAKIYNKDLKSVKTQKRKKKKKKDRGKNPTMKQTQIM